MNRTAGTALMTLSLGLSGAGAVSGGPQAPEPQAGFTPQAPPTPPAAPEARPSPEASDVAVPTRDIFDVIRAWRHKPEAAPPRPEDYKKLMIAGAPVISYNPASGAGIGAAGNVAFYRGEPENTRISSLVGSLIGTTKEQLLFNAKIDASTPNNTWGFHSDNRLYWTGQDTYGLGTGTTPDDAVNARYDFFRFYETLYRQVHKNLYAGVGFLYDLHSDVRPSEDDTAVWPDSPYVTYSTQNGFDLGSQTSAGFTVHALFDSRDGSINPSRGVYANVDYRMFFEGFLGGSSTWQQFDFDLRTYLRLSKDARHRLAFWTFANIDVGGAAPYFDLPATGMDTYGRSGRGYAQGRFRGERLFYGEAEYRWTFTRNGLLGVVAFLNTETLSDKQTGEKLFDSFATGAGVGLRLMINKRSKTNLGLDIGFGKDGSSGVYLAVQEAF